MQNEIGSLLPEVILILEALLIQVEQPERQRVARVHFGKRTYAWYFSSDDLGLRRRVHEQLEHFATKGWLKLNWKKYERGNILESVDLIMKQDEVINTLYSLISRISPKSQRAALKALLSGQKLCGGWFDSFVSWSIMQVEGNRSPAPLSLSDLEASRDILRSLHAIATLCSPTLERVLSIELFEDSKRLEELRAAVTMVLRTHASGASLYDDDWTLLQAHNIFRPPEYVPIAGPLSLTLKETGQNAVTGSQLQLEPNLPSIALSEDILRNAIVTRCFATALITVENMTSFSELLLVRPSSLAVVFTGGFASPSLIMFLRSLRTCRPDLLMFHWGDIDVGGLRILAHLRRHLSNVSPLCMDIETFEEYQASAQPLTSNDRLGINTLLADSTLADCFLLMHHLMQRDLKLEQEAIRATHVLSSPVLKRLNILGS